MRHLSSEEIQQIKALYASGIHQQALADQFHSSKSTIQRVINGRKPEPRYDKPRPKPPKPPDKLIYCRMVKHKIMKSKCRPEYHPRICKKCIWDRELLAFIDHHLAPAKRRG